MKQLLLLTICIFSFAFCLQAQITITNANMPGSSDTIRYSNTSTFINYDTTGAGITWDFSTLTPITQGLYEYKPSSSISLVYSLFFGFGSYGLKTADTLNLGAFTLNNLYDFYKNTSSSFRIAGRGMEYLGVPVPSDFSDEDEIYRFPLDYTDYDSTTFAVSFSLAATLELFQKGYRINEVEGWCNVITPYGTFNCLKLVSTVYEMDSLVVGGFGLPPFPRTTRQIKWLATSEKIPVFEVNGTMFGSTFIPTYARYRDNYDNCLSSPPSVSFTASQTTGTVSDIFDFTNTTDCALSYFWAITPNTLNYVSGTSQTSATPSVQFSDTGYYTVKLTAINLLGIDSNTQVNYIHIIDPTIGISGNSVSGNSFFVYPNPSSGKFEVRSKESGVRSSSLLNFISVEIYNLLGEKVFSEHTPLSPGEGWGVRSINLRNPSPGIYILKLQTEGEFFIQKLVVE